MASIRKRGPYQWEVRIRRKGYGNLYRTFEYKKDAEAWAAEAESQLRKGRRVATGDALRMTLGEALAFYEKHRLPQLKGHQPGYIIDYWKTHPLADRRLGEIRGWDVRCWIKERLDDDVLRYLRDENGKVVKNEKREPIEIAVRKVGPKAVYNDLMMLSSVFSYVRTAFELTEFANPCSLVPKDERPKPQERERRLDEAEHEKLMEHAQKHENEMMPLIIAFAVETAMRKSEIAGLRKAHVNLEQRWAILRNTKNGTDRKVPLSPVAVEILKVVPETDGPTVFGMNADAIGRQFNEVREAAGINGRDDIDNGLTFHDLRHEATSRLLESGLSLREVAHTVGHRTLQMLMRYTHPKAKDVARKMANGEIRAQE
jgi:integrase